MYIVAFINRKPILLTLKPRKCGVFVKSLLQLLLYCLSLFLSVSIG